MSEVQWAECQGESTNSAQVRPHIHQFDKGGLGELAKLVNRPETRQYNTSKSQVDDGEGGEPEEGGTKVSQDRVQAIALGVTGLADWVHAVCFDEDRDGDEGKHELQHVLAAKFQG